MLSSRYEAYFYYRGMLEDGTVFDERISGDPMHVRLGAGLLPPGLDAALLEMVVGEEHTLELSPEDGFGSYDDDGVLQIPRYMIPDHQQLPIGGYISWFGEKKRNNAPVSAKVVSADEFKVTLDLNHPLAGEVTRYWIKLVRKEERIATEIDEVLRQISAKANAERAITRSAVESDANEVE